ncbi:MAG: hypothetical protein ACE37H_01905 [Phycisphaeraceae bacterium]
MYFRIQDLQQQAYAGFKKCFVTRVPARSLAPFGTEFPQAELGEVEIIAVPPKLRSLNEEWLQVNGGSLIELRKIFAYGFQDYIARIRPQTYLDRMPEDGGFKDCTGFESWSRSKIEAHAKSKSIVGFMIPRRLVFNMAKGTCSFDFEYRLDTQLPNHIYSIDITKKAEVHFASPRTPGPGVLEQLPPRPLAKAPPQLTDSLWWVKQNRFAGMPLPTVTEIPALSSAGFRAVISIGKDINPAAFESAGMRYLCLPMPDSHDADESHVQLVASVCNETQGAILVCGEDQQAVGTMLGIGLLTEGQGVEEALEMLESANPAAVESMGQIEYLYGAAMMLGLDLE